MAPDFLTSRLKSNLFGKDYTWEKKHLDEVFHRIESKTFIFQQFNKLDDGKEQLNDELQKERQLNSMLKTECDSLSAQLKTIQAEFDTQLKAAAEKDHEKDEELRNLTDALEKSNADHHAKIQKLRHELEEMRKRLSAEKYPSDCAKLELIKDLDTVQAAHNKTDKRRKRAEYEIATLQDELDKVKREKLEVEVQLAKERKQAAIHDIMKDLSTMLQDVQNEDSHQLTHLVERLINGIQLQMHDQQQDHEAICKEFIKEQTRLEQLNSTLLDNLYNSQNAHNKTEGRRKQLEDDFVALKDEFEKTVMMHQEQLKEKSEEPLEDGVIARRWLSKKIQ